MKTKDTIDAQTDLLDTDFPCYIIVDVYKHADGRPPTYVTQGFTYLKPGLNIDPRCFDLGDVENFWKHRDNLEEDEGAECGDENKEGETDSDNAGGILGAANVLIKHAQSQIDQAVIEAKRDSDHGFTFYKEDILAALQPCDPGECCYLCEVEAPVPNFVKVNSEGATQTWKSPVMHVGKPKKLTKRVVQDLIKRGANVRACHDAPLICAAGSGDAPLVTLFLKHGADPHALDSQAFFDALNREDYAVVRALLSGGFDVHYAEERPLRWAVTKGYTKGVELMLAHGADVHVGEVYKERHKRSSLCDYETVLETAARAGNLQIFTKLLDAGADLQISLVRVLKAVAEANAIEILWHVIECIESQGLEVMSADKEEALKIAIYQGNVAVAKVLFALPSTGFKYGQQVLSDYTRGSALAHALKQQHTEMFDYLLAKFKWSNDELSDAVGYAIQQENYEAMNTLFKAGADPLYLNYSLFKTASDCGNIEAIRFMDKILKIQKAGEIPAGVSAIDIPEKD